MEPVRSADNSYHVRTESHHRMPQTRTTPCVKLRGMHFGEREARDEKVVGFYVFVYRLGRLAYGLFS
jgi:hypothetical protein